MKTLTPDSRLNAARKEFEHSFSALRRDLQQEWGLSWKSAQAGLLVLAAGIGFGLAIRSRQRARADAVKRLDA